MLILQDHGPNTPYSYHQIRSSGLTMWTLSLISIFYLPRARAPEIDTHELPVRGECPGTWFLVTVPHVCPIHCPSRDNTHVAIYSITRTSIAAESDSNLGSQPEKSYLETMMYSQDIPSHPFLRPFSPSPHHVLCIEQCFCLRR
jgi:hypothetical protein